MWRASVAGFWKLTWMRALATVGLSVAFLLTVPAAQAKAKTRGETQVSGKRAAKAAVPARSSAATAKNRKAAAATRRGSARVASASGPRVRMVRGRLVRVAARQAVPVEPAVMSVGALSGLHTVGDPLELKSGAALVVDQDSNQVLFSKNSHAVLPIASITKLMTALVVVEAKLPLDETLSVDQADIEETQGSRSRLAAGTSLTRGDLLQLALMSSENRAAHALSRNYPGGSAAFVAAMNQRAQQLGMHDTRFVEATGLSPDNRSSASDLVRLMNAASSHDVIRGFSTSKESMVPVGADERMVHFRSTNGLIGNPDWEISLQKTGYIAAAGRCLVMQAQMAGRRLTMVLLDSAGRYSRFADAERIRKWLATTHLPAATAATVSAAMPAAASVR